MRSIYSTFKTTQTRNRGLGDYVCLAKAVKGRFFSRKSIVKTLKSLATVIEYDTKDFHELVDHLDLLTNTPEEVEKRG